MSKSKLKFQRRFITLIEIMIVMFLIALITGVVAYNYRGSLDEGRVFKTKTGISKVQTILTLEAAKDPGFIDSVQSKWQSVVIASPLVQDPNSMIRDGWGEMYEVSVDQDGIIRVESKKYNDYLNTHQSLFSK